MSNAQNVSLGTCWGTPNGQDLSMPSYMASGFLVVAEAVLRRWSTNRGELIDDPDFGTNVADSISDDLSPRDIAYLQQQLAAEAQKDERVLKASVTVTLAAGVLTVTGAILTAAGPFKMVVAVSAVTTTLLSVST